MRSAEYKSKSFPNSGAIAQSFKSDSAQAHYVKTSVSSSGLDIDDFLHCRTPESWVDTALTHLDLLLVDHAHCEKKAAATALSLIFRYPQHDKLCMRLSKLAREEMRHFEQVSKIMQVRQIKMKHLSAGQYAQTLKDSVRKKEPFRLIDTLIVSAIIEARSCERFAILAPKLEDKVLRAFYSGLLHSESRHFQHYLAFAKSFATESLDDRIDFFLRKEAQLILSKDQLFRFHSGQPSK